MRGTFNTQAPANIFPSPDVQDGNSISQSKFIEINLTDLLEEGELALNIRVQGGDVIHIPERELQVYYVIGDVGRPGTYELPKDIEVLLTQGLAKAGGPTKTAKQNSSILVRYDELGTRQELAVNFSDILKGKKADCKNYQGYSSCPLVVSHNKMLLAEFGYDGAKMSDPILSTFLNKEISSSFS